MSTRTIGRKTKELLAITLLLNLAAIGWYAFLFNEIKAKNEHVSLLVNQIEGQASEENMQSSVKALVLETAPQREKLHEYLIGKEDAVSFLELLESVGDGVGVSVSIDTVDKQELTETPDVERLKLSLKATGSWAGIVRFVGLLEALPYEAHIEQVVVSKEDGVGDPWRIDTTLGALKEK